MNIFSFRNRLIDDYASYVQSFIQIRNPQIQSYVQEQLRQGVLWPDPLIQLSPPFEPSASIDELVAEGVLHSECARIFRVGKTQDGSQGHSLRLHKHQDEAIRVARSGASYVLTTGTGSGKSLAYMVPLVDAILRHGTGRGIQAIVVYPMNALANSQRQKLEKFLTLGYPDGKEPVTFACYTGQEKQQERDCILERPPDILLTNYVMLELILTRFIERRLLTSAALHFLVLDELHTYRGRQGADVALLVRCVRERLAIGDLQCVGTLATLASEGNYDEQRCLVAGMASQLFGTEVLPQHVIGETLKRSTPDEHGVRDGQGMYTEAFRHVLTKRISDSTHTPPEEYEAFLVDPLSVWLEDTFGVTKCDGRIVRSEPQSIEGLHQQDDRHNSAAHRLSVLTGVSLERCIQVIQEGLLAGYTCSPDPITNRPPFAFRLHQFISKGDAIYSSLEANPYLTFQGQQFVPGDRSRVLLPLVFCRECGQEYYSVQRVERQQHTHLSMHVYVDRALYMPDEEQGQAGFLYYSQENPWPMDEDALLERLPEEWLEEFRGGLRVRRNRRDALPEAVRVRPDGVEIDVDNRHENALDVHFLPVPFRFCLQCGVSYGSRQRNDFSKLASLSSEGRSTATTILSLSAMLRVKEDPHQSIPPKMLSFTDNRQDASLQAGHFNDFIDVGLLRSALYQAVKYTSSEGINHEELTQRVFEALHLPLSSYAVDPHVKYQALQETQRALRNVLGYRLYRDLKRGWRITSPNLEQCGLLIIDYLSLDEVCEDEEVWQAGQGGHPALLSASSQTRKRIARVLLDYMRRELAIKVDYLSADYQENMQQQSSQRLISPWAIDENEPKEYATTLFPRPRGQEADRSYVYLSARGGFGQYLRRATTFPEYHERLRSHDTEQIILNLLRGLRSAGLVECVYEPPHRPRGQQDERNYGYQLPASALIWKAGDGKRGFYDPITVPRIPPDGRRTNAFFVGFYRSTATKLEGLEAREHTAQVPYELREEREQRFRENSLPVLFCSPTMELGIDIAELNLVNMRNIPPTPANYAQRSGRAGRSGQPALVFSYCSTGSPHDQYFFKRPEQMVAGAVTPPSLDLANQDLLRAHVYAIWLAETGLSLGQSLRDILNVSGDSPSLQLLDHVQAAIQNLTAKRRAYNRAEKVLASIRADLEPSGWYTDNWLTETLDQVMMRFNQTCERWRDLYRSALSQSKAQSLIVLDASRSADDKQQAARLRAEAESQLKLLTEVDRLEQSDFYSYRYFASEGFLPGYNFPRLPSNTSSSTSISPFPMSSPFLNREPDNEQAGWSGGFDVVLGNPPWEHIELKEQEWFAQKRPDIAQAEGAARKRKIDALAHQDKALFEQYVEAKQQADGMSHFIRNSEHYPLCGRGRVNTYAIFAELNRLLVSPKGRVGCIVQSGIATDDTTKLFFQDITTTRTLASLYDFDNTAGIFPTVDSRYKFCLLTLSGLARPNLQGAQFAFFLHTTSDLKNSEKRFMLTPDDLWLINPNPNTRTCPIFRSQRDAELTKGIYQRLPVVVREAQPEQNVWDITFRQGHFNMTSDSRLFCTYTQLIADEWELRGNIFYKGEKRCLPLYEGKMISHYDSRFGSYTLEPNPKSYDVDATQHADPSCLAMPRYWVHEMHMPEGLLSKKGGLLGFRDVTNNTNIRTSIFSIVPAVPCGHKLPIVVFGASRTKEMLYLGTCGSSFIFDYVTRQKLGGTSMSYFILKQLPVLPPDTYESSCSWDKSGSLGEWIRSRALELIYTAWDLCEFARECGYDGPSFRWDEARRFLLRCELDAAYFHLYGIAREDVDYIMETFPIVRRKDEKEFGEYRTKRVILEMYDALATAMEMGTAYVTRLEPEAASVLVAHAVRVGMDRSSR